MKRSEKIINVSPDMVLYRILQVQPYSVEQALAEFIDNSIQSFIHKTEDILKIDGKGSSLKILIDINSEKKTIEIIDNAGGISSESIQEAMSLGSITGHDKRSLSVYGVGLKTSAVWFSDTWSLESSAIGLNEKITLNFDLNYFLDNKIDSTRVLIEEENDNEHYTKIKIRNHNRTCDVEKYKDEIIPFLLETFHRFIKGNKVSIKIKIDGQDIEANSKKLFIEPFDTLKVQEYNSDGRVKDESSEIIKWEKRVDNVNVDGKIVNGFVRLMEEGKYNQPGIRLLRNNRVIVGTSIKPNLPKRITGTKNKYGAQRIYGEVNLDDFEVNYQKTGFDDDLDSVYLKIGEILTKEPNIIAQTNNFRKRPKVPKTPGSGGSSSDLGAGLPGNKDLPPEPSSRISNKKITPSVRISNDLQKKSQKLFNLYESLCTLNLERYPVLSYAGTWVFFEILSQLVGNRDGNSNMESSLNAKISSLYGQEKSKNSIKNLKYCIRKISEEGNIAKHSPDNLLTDGRPIKAYFTKLESFILDCFKEIKDE